MFYDKAKRDGAKENIIVDKQKIPLQFNRGLLHVPIRESTLEELQLLHVYDISANFPWDLQNLDDELDPSPNQF